MMKQSLLLLACLVAAGSAALREYPPGISPALCPNYPYCDNALMALHTPVAYTAPGFPANVNPAGCPNYPFCNTGSPAYYPAY